MTGRKWGGSKAQRWTAAVLREYGTTCHLRLEGCTITATEGDHLKPRSTHPWLQYAVSNGRPACRHCNATRGRNAIRPVVAVDHRNFFESPPSSPNDVRRPPPGSGDEIREKSTA